MTDYQKYALPNGARVVLIPNKNTEAVTLAVLFGVGSRDENTKLAGISHFLEHLFFKGTKKRSSSGAISRELDKIGASYNAFTSKEETGFWVKSASKDFKIALDVLGDMLLNSLFDNKEIKKEKSVIEQEMDMNEDNPRRKVHDVLENIVFGDEPIGRDIIGKKESLKSITREDILHHKQKYYLGKNTVIAVAGNFKTKEVLEDIKKVFGRLPRKARPEILKTNLHKQESKVKIKTKKVDQTHFSLGFRSFDMYDEKRYVLDILAVVLGGCMSSKLFQEIRVKKGLAYYIYASPSYYRDAGIFGISSGVRHDKLEEAVGAVVKIIREIKKKGLKSEELKNAKSHIRGQLALQFETTDDVAGYFANQELFYNKIIMAKEIMDKIEKVTNRDIVEVANEIFTRDNTSLAVITKEGDFQNQETKTLEILKSI